MYTKSYKKKTDSCT